MLEATFEREGDLRSTVTEETVRFAVSTKKVKPFENVDSSGLRSEGPKKKRRSRCRGIRL